MDPTLIFQGIFGPFLYFMKFSAIWEKLVPLIHKFVK
jgi:hypothetical protein